MLGRPRRKLTREEFQYLNILRIDSAYQTFSQRNLMRKLCELGAGFWRDSNFIPFLVKYGILEKKGYNKYSFNSTPFTFEQLQTAIHKYQCKKAKNRKHSKVDKGEVTVITSINPIEEAITLLKNNGYKVLVQHFDVEKALLNPEKSVQDFIVWTDC